MWQKGNEARRKAKSLQRKMKTTTSMPCARALKT